MYRHVQTARVEVSAHGGEALQCQFVQNLERPRAVLGQLVLVEIYALSARSAKPYVRRLDIASMRRNLSVRLSMYVFSSR